MKDNHQTSEGSKEETNSNNGIKVDSHSNSEAWDRHISRHHNSDYILHKDPHDPLFGNGNPEIKSRDNSDTDTPMKEATINKGTSDDDSGLDLSKDNYIITDTDIITITNVRKEDLEYSTKNGRYFIRDKKSKHILILDNPTYLEYKQKVTKVEVKVEFELNEIIEKNKKFKLNENYEHPINTKNKNKHNSHEYFMHENAAELNNRHENSIRNFFTMQSEYKKGDVISRDLSKYATYISKQLDNHIEIATAYNDNEAVAVFTARKEAFSNYADLLIQSDDANHGIVVKKIIIEDTTYDAKELLVSDSVDSLNYVPVKDIVGTTKLADVKMLIDSVTDYENLAEVEAITEETALSDTMIEYMSGLKDLEKQLGIQRLPTYYDMHPIVFPEAV